MKLKIQVVSVADTGEEETIEVASVERNEPLRLDTLGLTLAEGKEILKDIQQVLVEQQITAHLRREAQAEAFRALSKPRIAAEPKSHLSFRRWRRRSECAGVLAPRG